ncbi:hypothetical protein V3589_11145 [Sinorhizobium fredii]|uniref:hypothetical protein n=1 Tax=Rhizobium fredii TaxID=380 RepID=UPI0030A65068
MAYKTDLLDITLVDPNQTGKAASINEGLNGLANSLGKVLNVDVGAQASPYTLPFGAAEGGDKTGLQFRVLQLTGTAAAEYTVIVPAKEHEFLVDNRSDQTVVVKTADGSGYNAASGRMTVVYCDGSAVYGLAWAEGAVEEAPADASYYVRRNSTWTLFPSGGGGGGGSTIPDAPNDGWMYGWQSGAWTAIPSAGRTAVVNGGTHWRLVLRQDFASGFLQILDLEFREVAGVAQTTPGTPITDVFGYPENAFDEVDNNYTYASAPKNGNYLGIALAAARSCTEVAIKKHAFAGVETPSLNDFDIECSLDGGSTWHKVAEIRDANIVGGPGTAEAPWHTFALPPGREAAPALVEAPKDGQIYGRKDAAWVTVQGGGSLGWADITGKPATFPPGPHGHPWADITAKTALLGALPATVGVEGSVLKAGSGGTIAWGADETGGDGGIEEAPADGTLYGRQDGAWEPVPTGAPTAVELSFFAGGTPTANELLFRYEVRRPFAIPAGMAGSGGSSGAAATGAAALSVKKNGTQVGTATWAAAGTAATLAMASATSFAVGDVLTVTAPATPDTTLADVSMTIAATLN